MRLSRWPGWAVGVSVGVSAVGGLTGCSTAVRPEPVALSTPLPLRIVSQAAPWPPAPARLAVSPGPAAPARPTPPPAPQDPTYPLEPARLHLALPPVGRQPVQLKPLPACPQTFGPDGHLDLQVAPAPGGLTLSFWNPAPGDVLSYLIRAVPTADPGSTSSAWQPLAAPTTCRQVSTTLTGLLSGRSYTVEVQAVRRNGTAKDTGGPPTVLRSVGRSEAIPAG